MFPSHASIRSGLALSALLLACAATGRAQATPLTPVFMPQPAQSTLSGQTTGLAALPKVVWAHAPSPLLKRALARFEARLEQIGVVPGAEATKGGVVLRIKVGKDPAYLSLDAREGYALDVSSIRV